MKTEAVTKTRNLNIRTSADEYSAIKNIATFNGQTMSGFVLNLIHDYMDDLEDIKAIDDYEKAKARGDVEYISWDQVQKDLNL
jgi:predicted DNA-binding protein